MDKTMKIRIKIKKTLEKSRVFIGGVKKKLILTYDNHSCGAQNRRSLLLVVADFDRYAISPSLFRPPDAVGLNAVNSVGCQP